MRKVKTKVDWFEIYTFENDGIGSDVINGKIWESHIINFLKNNLKSDSVFLDVGSNYGWHSIIASRYCEKVFSFEPQKVMFDIQKLSIEGNNIQNITLQNIGLGNENKKAQMNSINYELPWVNIGDLSIGSGGEETELKTIDSLNLPKIDLIKIDVQGYEKFVLEGGIEKIKTDKPIVIVELENFQMKKFNYDDSFIFSFFNELDFIPYYLEYVYPADHVFVHKSRIEEFTKKNNILILSNSNSLNNNLQNGVKYKII